jgi:hypothetical protein
MRADVRRVEVIGYLHAHRLGGLAAQAAHADLYVGLAKGYLFVSSCDFCIGSQD